MNEIIAAHYKRALRYTWMDPFAKEFNAEGSVWAIEVISKILSATSGTRMIYPELNGGWRVDWTYPNGEITVQFYLTSKGFRLAISNNKNITREHVMVMVPVNSVDSIISCLARAGLKA